jgi:hypothetical protein
MRFGVVGGSAIVFGLFLSACSSQAPSSPSPTNDSLSPASATATVEPYGRTVVTGFSLGIDNSCLATVTFTWSGTRVDTIGGFLFQDNIGNQTSHQSSTFKGANSGSETLSWQLTSSASSHTFQFEGGYGPCRSKTQGCGDVSNQVTNVFCQK